MSRTATPADVIAGTARWCVVCGDGTKSIRALPTGSLNAIVSDPPYGVDLAGTDWDAEIPSQAYLAQNLRVSKGSVVWFGASPPRVLLQFGRYKPIPDRTLIWSPAMSFSKSAANGVMYRWHPIWVWRMTDVQRGILPLDMLRHSTDAGASGGKGTKQGYFHPAQKPLGLMRDLVAAFVPLGGVVGDFFAGTGTTGVAAILEGRRAILAEIDPQHAEEARRRCEGAEAGITLAMPKQPPLLPLDAMVFPR